MKGIEGLEGRWLAAALLLGLAACTSDAGESTDLGVRDLGQIEAGAFDAAVDEGPDVDAMTDAAVDAEADSGEDAGTDAGLEPVLLVLSLSQGIDALSVRGGFAEVGTDPVELLFGAPAGTCRSVPVPTPRLGLGGGPGDLLMDGEGTPIAVPWDAALGEFAATVPGVFDGLRIVEAPESGNRYAGDLGTLPDAVAFTSAWLTDLSMRPPSDFEVTWDAAATAGNTHVALLLLGVAGGRPVAATCVEAIDRGRIALTGGALPGEASVSIAAVAGLRSTTTRLTPASAQAAVVAGQAGRFREL